MDDPCRHISFYLDGTNVQPKKATYHDAFSQNIAPQICSIRYLESRSERREEKIYGLRLFAEQSDLGELGVSEPKILESKVTR